MNELEQSTPEGDLWFNWLSRNRYGGGSSDHRRAFSSTVGQMRDRVLDGLRLFPGISLMDVGSGEGLIAFGAADRLDGEVKITFVDISGDLLSFCETEATRRGINDRCTFICASADRLRGIDSNSLDGVATRSVLAYVSDKPAAFREFRRVLRPGGRLSIAEPINQDFALETCAMSSLVAADPTGSQSARFQLLRRFRSRIHPSTQPEIRADPMTNFNERDLVLMSRAAGFSELHLEFHIDLRRERTMNWETYLDSSPHPWSATPREILQTDFTAEERKSLEKSLRMSFDSDEFTMLGQMAYLNATKAII